MLNRRRVFFGFFGFFGFVFMKYANLWTSSNTFQSDLGGAAYETLEKLY